MKDEVVSWPTTCTVPHLIYDQMQLLVAVLCAHEYFRKSEFGLWIFEISRSRQKPEEDREAGVSIPRTA